MRRLTPGTMFPGMEFITDGSGTWDLVASSWTLNGGLSDTPFTSGDAVFGGGVAGAAGTVALGQNINANSNHIQYDARRRRIFHHARHRFIRHYTRGRHDE